MLRYVAPLFLNEYQVCGTHVVLCVTSRCITLRSVALHCIASFVRHRNFLSFRATAVFFIIIPREETSVRGYSRGSRSSRSFTAAITAVITAVITAMITAVNTAVNTAVITAVT